MCILNTLLSPFPRFSVKKEDERNNEWRVEKMLVRNGKSGIEIFQLAGSLSRASFSILFERAWKKLGIEENERRKFQRPYGGAAFPVSDSIERRAENKHAGKVGKVSTHEMPVFF